MDWNRRNVISLAADLKRLQFEPQANTVLQHFQFENPISEWYETTKLSDAKLVPWLKGEVWQEHNQVPIHGIRLILAYRASDTSINPNDPGAETLSHIPFSRHTFQEIIGQFSLSSSFVRTIRRGEIHFSSTLMDQATSAYPLRGFNMRMGNSWSRDLAMSTCTNVETGITCAIFHGCDKQDEKILKDWLKHTICSVGHPLFLPALFAELQLRRHKRLRRDNWTNLIALYANTGQYASPLAGMDPSTYSQTDQLDYNRTTREVLSMYQNTSFLEQALGKFQKQLRQMITQIELLRTVVPESRMLYIEAEGTRIKIRLEEMIDDYDSLIGDCKLVTDGAKLLIGAIWNLIAQRDNLVNQSIAADSRELAAAARQDSSAMRTIAFVTMGFLPGTFVASFFAMPLLDWNAPVGKPIMSTHLWIYWAVTLPLTAAVILLWFAWNLVFGSQAKQVDRGLGNEMGRSIAWKKAPVLLYQRLKKVCSSQGEGPGSDPVQGAAV